MAITATTLAAAAGASDTTISVASATGITAPNFTAGTGITYLFIDQEILLVLNVVGTFVSVQRGLFGTPAQPHLINTNVMIGLPTDFPIQTEVFKTFTSPQLTEGALVWPGIFLAGSADAIPVVPGLYVVKTAGVDAMTLAAPTAGQEGIIIQVWSDTTNAHTITATSLFANGTALKTTATYAAFRGAGVILRACNLVWHVLSNTAVTFT